MRDPCVLNVGRPFVLSRDHIQMACGIRHLKPSPYSHKSPTIIYHFSNQSIFLKRGCQRFDDPVTMHSSSGSAIFSSMQRCSGTCLQCPWLRPWPHYFDLRLSWILLFYHFTEVVQGSCAKTVASHDGSDLNRSSTYARA